MRPVQATPGRRCRPDQGIDPELGGFLRERPVGPDSSMPHRRKYALDRVRCAKVIPVLGREIEEGQQRIPIVGGTDNRLFVLCTVFCFEPIQCRDGVLSLRGVVNIVEV